jgi:hypothetical protein
MIAVCIEELSKKGDSDGRFLLAQVNLASTVSVGSRRNATYSYSGGVRFEYRPGNDNLNVREICSTYPGLQRRLFVIFLRLSKQIIGEWLV